MSERHSGDCLAPVDRAFRHRKQTLSEHILPQKPGADWKLPAEVMQGLYNRLGNQALLAGSVNSKLGNMGFQAKQKLLGSSPFSLTNMVAKASDWGEKEIVERQNHLANLAKAAWPFTV